MLLLLCGFLALNFDVVDTAVVVVYCFVLSIDFESMELNVHF